MTVAFRVAASARIGFGHLVRATRLARALGVPPCVSIRGPAAAGATGRRLGARLLTGPARSVVRPDLRLLVIDDPSRRAALPWLRAARRAGVPVASMHDVGIAPLPSDLAVDASLEARRVRGLGVGPAACRLGAAYAVLPTDGPAGRVAKARRSPGRVTILIGLGGGRQARAGLSIARHLARQLGSGTGKDRVRVLLSLGLDPAGAERLDVPPRTAIVAPAQFRAALQRATVAVVAGGTTLYEACALGTPVVAVPVVPGQATTVRRFVRAGLAAAVRLRPGDAVGSNRWGQAVAAAALDLVSDAGRRSMLRAAGPRAIDGQGAARLAQALTALMGGGTMTRARTSG